MKAQWQKNEHSQGVSRGCTHSNTFSFSIFGRAMASSRAPPSPRAFQDSLRQRRNPSGESGQTLVPLLWHYPSGLAFLQELIPLSSWQVNIPLDYRLNFEDFPPFHPIFPCMIRHQGVSVGCGYVRVLQAQGRRCESWKCLSTQLYPMKFFSSVFHQLVNYWYIYHQNELGRKY